MKISLPHFENARVMVVGDVMLDRYWHGGTNRISPEAPVPVVHINQCDECPGGAGNVALNIASLLSKPLLLGVVGDDAAATTLELKLNSAGVYTRLQRIANMPTVTKLRVLSLHQQLIRLDFEQPFFNHEPHGLLNDYQELLQNCQAVILSDYHKGTISSPTALISAAHQAKIPIFVDPKGNNFAIYRGATMLTPNRREFEAVVGTCHSEAELVDKGVRLLEELDLKALLITRGAEGMTLIQRDGAPLHLPARAHEVYDVTGAGDTVIAVLASAVAAGQDLTTATTLANIAAGIVVTKTGAASVTPHELRRALRKFHGSDLGVLTEDEALLAILDGQAHGEKVVMTNGCFDVLHAGHVAYLEEAKSLGHRLLIAVNDDGSVGRLKGHTRPINPLADRMNVLASLRAVDWVVPFSEDTPERLIRKLNPDVLVKGGDYQVDQIAGARYLLDRGSKVEILSFLPGRSSSKIIKALKMDEDITS